METVVDYEAIPNQARAIRERGQELNNELNTAYTSIANMHGSWYGKRYNSLVVEFNNLIPQLNELLDLVVGEIPFALETVANNYSTADKGTKVASAQKTAPKKVTSLATPNDVGMKFVSSEVTAVQKSVSSNFQKAKDKMNEVEATYAKITWTGSAAEAFGVKLKKLKNNIIQAFDNINTQFTKLMNQSLQDMQSAESSSTVK